MNRRPPLARGSGWQSRARQAPQSVHSSRLHDNMNGMTKRLKTALMTRGHTAALKDATVKPRTFEFDFEAVPASINLIKAVRRVVRDQDFVISELAQTPYLSSRAFGQPLHASPC